MAIAVPIQNALLTGSGYLHQTAMLRLAARCQFSRQRSLDRTGGCDQAHGWVKSATLGTFGRQHATKLLPKKRIFPAFDSWSSRTWMDWPGSIP